MLELSKFQKEKATVVIIIGMAGSGKTTLLQRINSYIQQYNIGSYLINLDPAVKEIPYDPNIDIRDIVNYKQTMRNHHLGPNGAILTSLNLFATKFDQVLSILEQRQNDIDYILIDTPGQIEVFSWSASGQIITESLAKIFPTILLYVIDTPRCTDPITFMSNMSYACSMLYKTKLPFLIAFNKNDEIREELCLNWMQNLEKFQCDCNRAKYTYIGTMMKELALVLSEFYKNIKSIGVSAVSGYGMNQMLMSFHTLTIEYWKFLYPIIQTKILRKQTFTQFLKKKKVNKLRKEIKSDQEINYRSIVANFSNISILEKKKM